MGDRWLGHWGVPVAGAAAIGVIGATWSESGGVRLRFGKTRTSTEAGTAGTGQRGDGDNNDGGGNGGSNGGGGESQSSPEAGSDGDAPLERVIDFIKDPTVLTVSSIVLIAVALIVAVRGRGSGQQVSA